MNFSKIEYKTVLNFLDCLCSFFFRNDELLSTAVHQPIALEELETIDGETAASDEEEAALALPMSRLAAETLENVGRGRNRGWKPTDLRRSPRRSDSRIVNRPIRFCSPRWLDSDNIGGIVLERRIWRLRWRKVDGFFRTTDAFRALD